MNVDLTKLVPDVGKIVDDVLTTDEERLSSIDNRHSLDMQSDSLIAKAVRPILSFIYTALYVYLVLVAVNSGAVGIAAAIATTGGIALAIVGFYFTGRTKNKAVTLQAKAAIEITKLKLKQTLSEERKEARRERVAERRLERKNKVK